MSLIFPNALTTALDEIEYALLGPSEEATAPADPATAAVVAQAGSIRAEIQVTAGSIAYGYPQGANPEVTPFIISAPNSLVLETADEIQNFRYRADGASGEVAIQQYQEAS